MSGNYLVTVRDINGCTASASTFVEVDPYIDCVWLTSNSPVCENQDLIIFLNCLGYSGDCQFNNSTFIVQGSNGLLPFEIGTNTLTIPNIDSDNSGTITITMTSPNGCSTIVRDIDILVYPGPTVSIENPGMICGGQTVTIIPQHSDFITSFNWHIYPNYYSYDPVLNYNFPTGVVGTFPVTLTITDLNGCTVSSSTELNVTDAFGTFTANASSNSPVCLGEDIYLLGNTSNNASDNTYIWTGPNGFESDIQNPIINGSNINNIGIYYFSVVNSVSCVASATVEINVIQCDAAFSVSCFQIPATCRDSYNGAIGLQITNGVPPYEVNIYRDCSLLLCLELAGSGEQVIELPGVEPNNHPITIVLTDDADNQYICSVMEGLHYAWETVLTNNNLYYENNYQNQVFSVGDDYNNQHLDFYQDFTFTNCTFYTGTHHFSGWESSEWNINCPNTVTFENCTIKSGCPDLMWQGITVHANTSSQSEEDQGKIVFTNSSISDANYAIQSTAGGRITARFSQFINNRYGIYIYDADYQSSMIYQNDFLTNQVLKIPALTPLAHVYLYKVRDISFAGNTFKNTLDMNTPNYPVQNRGTGIQALISSFKLTPLINNLPQTPWSVNSFEGLYYGVNAKLQDTYAPQIRYCNFTNNYRGIHVMAETSPRIIFNDFTTTMAIPPVTDLLGYPVTEEPETNVSYAAYINSCTNFTLEENTVEGIQAGIYVYNTGSAGHRVYRNKFGDVPGSNAFDGYSMYAGTLVVGKNSDYVHGDPFSTGQTGLEVRCNDYTSNEFAISVVNGNMRLFQGEPNGSTNQLAGNQFHKTLANGMDFSVHIDAAAIELDLGASYNYWEHEDLPGSTDNYYRMLDHFSGVIPYYITGIEYNDNSCPSAFDPPIGDPVDDVLSDLSDQEAGLAAANQVYADIVDRGDTEYMRSLAVNLSLFNFRQYAPVLSNGGYLSDAVFEALLANRSAPKAAITAILVTNSPLPGNIWEDVKNSTYLNTWYKLLIGLCQGGTSQRTQLEYKIARFEQGIVADESLLMTHAVNNDSVPEVKDMAIAYFGDAVLGDQQAVLNVYRLHQATGDYASARNDLEILRKMAAPANSAELQKFCDIGEIYLDFRQGNDSLADKSATLLEAALDGSALYSATAQVLYELAADTVFAEYTPLPVPAMNNRKAEADIAATEADANVPYAPFVSVYPNPANELVFVEYNFSILYDEGYDLLFEQLGNHRPSDCENGNLVLYTSDGKPLQHIAIEQMQGSLVLETGDYAPGVYLLELTDCYGNKTSVKLTKNK